LSPMFVRPRREFEVLDGRYSEHRRSKVNYRFPPGRGGGGSTKPVLMLHCGNIAPVHGG